MPEPLDRVGSAGFWKSILVSRPVSFAFMAAAPILVLFLTVVAVFEMPLKHSDQSPFPARELRAQSRPVQPGALPDGPPDRLRGPGDSGDVHSPGLEIAVRAALILLVGILLYVPIAWVFQFARRTKLFGSDRTEAEVEFLSWLTAISVPYLVLGFAMAIEFHTLVEGKSEGMGAIAAIMVLYALSVLASFLYVEVRDLRSSFKKDMATTGDWLRYQLALTNYTTPIGTPGQKVSTLLAEWIELLKRSDYAPVDRKELQRNLLGTLLTSYIAEEAKNISGDLDSDRTPIWVKEIKEFGGTKDGLAFIATNVGFYAQFLETAVKGLSSSLPKNRCVVLATITYVLPPFWWNWPYANKHHGIYDPVERFRETLIKLAEKDENGRSLRVFRRMLVRNTSGQNPGVPAEKLSDKTLREIFDSTLASLDHWEDIKNWKILKGEGDKPLTSLVCRSPVNTESLAEPIRWTRGDLLGDNDATKSPVYWMSSGNSPNPASITAEDVTSFYKRSMHASGGASEVCEIDFDTFRMPFSFDYMDTGGLNGCTEITFLGTCGEDCGSVWESHPEPQIGLAFLSNMTKGRDSIFLAVVTEDRLIRSLWSSVCATLNRRTRHVC